MQCAFCDEKHFSASCLKVTSVSKHKEILLKSGCYFTCLKTNHKSRECNSTKTCRHCHRKHHQSICETLADNPGSTTNTTSESSEQVTTTSSSVTGPANNVKCKVLFSYRQQGPLPLIRRYSYLDLYKSCLIMGASAHILLRTFNCN